MLLAVSRLFKKPDTVPVLLAVSRLFKKLNGYFSRMLVVFCFFFLLDKLALGISVLARAFPFPPFPSKHQQARVSPLLDTKGEQHSLEGEGGGSLFGRQERPTCFRYLVDNLVWLVTPVCPRGACSPLFCC